MDLANVIKKGGVVLIPTDTIYGISCDATNIDAIKKVYDIKERNYNNPLLILVSSIEMLNEYVKEINDTEKELIDMFWPGKLTILLKKNNKIDDLVTAGSEYVGVRIPDNKYLIDVIEKIGKPLISTSANKSGDEPVINPNILNDEILSKFDYVDNVGDLIASSSTLVQVDGKYVKILRDGDLTDRIKNSFRSR
jgi:tRNA threonylcarbamoyl adenosine modification protein (Sua5/YciO/YrdC/YwlC family)